MGDHSGSELSAAMISVCVRESVHVGERGHRKQAILHSDTVATPVHFRLSV